MLILWISIIAPNGGVHTVMAHSHYDDKLNKIFFVFHCHHNVNTTICYQDTHFFCCRCRYKKVQNPFHDDTKIMINMLLSPQCEWAVKTCSHCNGNGIIFIILVSLPLPSWMGSIGFSRNAQSWQCWHFCTTSNGNKLIIVTSWINFDATVHLTCYFEPKYIWWTTV